VNAIQPAAGFAFALGEEVVARLDCAEILDVARGVEVSTAPRPAWTIGSVIDQVALAGGRGYVLRSRYRGDTYVCIVPEDGIEGLA
jgi:hypothetical protein